MRLVCRAFTTSVVSANNHSAVNIYYKKPLKGFLKLSDSKQWKSSVRIGQNFKAKMAF